MAKMTGACTPEKHPDCWKDRKPASSADSAATESSESERAEPKPPYAMGGIYTGSLPRLD